MSAPRPLPTAKPAPVWRRLFSAEAVAPEHTGTRARWAEVLLLPLVTVGVAWLVNPDDPLLIHASFPWLWFGPVLVALRYGVLSGLISSLMLLSVWLVAEAAGMHVLADFPRHFFFGGGLLILLCGEFSDVWRDRNLRMDETNLYITERLSRLTKRHLLLNLSHDRLEQEMLARPGSLRDALAQLRNLVITSEGGEPLPAAEGLMQLLAQYANIEAAAIYLAEAGPDGPRPDRRIAEIGDSAPLTAGDALLVHALENRQLAHVAAEEVSLERNSAQLVVAPLVTSDNTLVGVLAVTKLPFYSLNVENLQMLSVILAYYADTIHAPPRVAAIRERLPTIPVMYAEEMARMMRLWETVGIGSHIVVMRFTGDRRDEIPAQFLRIKRGLDLYWQTMVGDHPLVAILMPFASASAKEGFLQRIDDWLHLRFGGDFDSLKIDIHPIDFAQDDPLAALERHLAP